jgi:uncharacterized protein YxeA
MKRTYICILLFIFIILVSVYNVYNESHEGFTPYIRGIYRPYIRDARIKAETLYTKHTNNLHNILRKFQIM